MPSLKTDHYSGLKQACKDCPHLIIDSDGVHVSCDPPMGECRLDWSNADSSISSVSTGEGRMP